LTGKISHSDAKEKDVNMLIGTAYIYKEIIKDYGLTENQAALIASDQTKKFHEELLRQRRIEMGLYKAIWRHSGISIVPRKSHEEADGKVYDIRKGCKIDGEYIRPKEKIGCNCWEQAVIE
jgi:uncharacterized protein with gpF-like domain